MEVAFFLPPLFLWWCYFVKHHVVFGVALDVVSDVALDVAWDVVSGVALDVALDAFYHHLEADNTAL